MRRLLIICAHFPPSAASGAFRMLGFSRHLPRFKWDVSVVACTRMPHEPVDDMLRSMAGGGNVHYVDYPQRRSARLRRRIHTWLGILDPHVTWCDAALSKCREVITAQRPDVLLTSGPPHSVHLLGKRLSRQFGIPLVTDFRDPWVASGRPLTGINRLRRRLEHSVLRTSAIVIANAPRAQELFTTAYPDCAAKVAVIPNGYDPDTRLPKQAAQRNGEVTILHAGELYAGRDPVPLLDAITGAERVSSTRAKWRLRFLGRTDECGLDLAAEGHSRFQRSQVVVEGQVSYDAAKEEMSKADILVLLDGPGRCVGVPAKIYEYIGAQRPILALAEMDGDTAWVLRASGVLHQIARPKDTAAIQQALLKLTDAVESGAPIQSTNPSELFTREAATRKLSLLLESITSRQDHLAHV